MNTAIDWNLMTSATIGNSAYQSLSNQQLSEIDEFCDRFDLELVKGDGSCIESFLAEAAEEAHDGLLAELLAMELEYRTRQGETPRQDEYVQRFPQQAGVIAGVFSGAKIATSAEAPTQSAFSHPSEPTDTGETIGPLNTMINVGNQLGPYKLLAKLGEGGMGVVYQARHTKLGKLVALKILPQHVLSRSDALSRFEREMLAVGSLQHPNIIQALDAGEINGAHYLSMEYVEGQDLQQSVQTRGTMSVVDACKAIRQAAQGLAAAHDLGVVHRDIKPSNLFVAKQTGQIKILDMGLALLAQAEKPAALTFNGQCFGTPDYMAPEQWSDAHTCDARSDLYSLGCTLYFLLVGRPPYHSEIYPSTANKMKGHMLDAIPDLALARPDVPAGVVAIYLKLMAKVPSERFATGDELATALTPWAEALPAPSAPATAPTGPVVRPSSPNRSETSDTLNASPPAALAAPMIQAVATPLAGQGSPPRRPLTRWLLAAGGPAAFVLLGVIIITITHKDGTKTTIEVPDTSRVEVTKKGDNAPATSKPSWDGWPADAPAPAIAPFNAKQDPQPPTFKNSIGMEFVLVPKGKSWLGGGADKPGDQEVVIPADFYLGKYQVTQGEWEKVMDDNPSSFSRYGACRDAVKDISDADLKRFPMETVSWDDCQLFVARLNAREKDTGWVYRLPKEVEWEYACRGGPQSDQQESAFEFYFAKPTNTLLPSQANFRTGSERFLNRTCRVGSYEPNVLGFHDMHGNVREWCDDTHKGVDGALLRVDKGGSWFNGPTHCRAAFRYANPPSLRLSHQGLRLAGVPSSEAKTPSPAIAPFNTEQAQQHQAAWAKYLNVPVEHTNNIGMRFRLIPPGEFLMGSTLEEIAAELKRPELDLHLHFWRTPIESEGPQHKVVLTKPIYVGVTEVTQAQYELVMGTNPSQFSSTGEGKEAVANLETGNYPVEMVSFNESVEFCARLSRYEHMEPFNVRSDQTVTTPEGTGYRLPTEAEWEFACRAGTTSRFWSGDENEDLIQAGWCSSNAGGRTHAAGELNANPFGLSDMHGNVWEWVQDGWDPKFYGQFQENVAMDPFCPLSAGTMPMRRGGSFMQVPELVRSSSRLLYHTDNEMGFRVVLVVEGLLVSDPGGSSQSNDDSQSDVPANDQATPDEATPDQAP
jgi:formylglycine-generating enzyme required for sulfatase activity